MKIRLMLVTLLCLFIFTGAVHAETDSKPTIALLFINNAKTSYDNETTEKMMSNFAALLNENYNVIPGEPYINRLMENGIEDIATAERQDILDIFKGENIDYVLFAEIQPFNRKETMRFFTQGIEIVATLPMKIIDVANAKYLYNGKFIERATDSTMFGSIGNKSVSLKALDLVILKLNSTLQARLPNINEKTVEAIADKIKNPPKSDDNNNSKTGR